MAKNELKVVDLRPEDVKDMQDPFAYPEDSALQGMNRQARGTGEGIRDTSDVRKHTHNGSDSLPIDLANIVSMFPTLDTAPTFTPTRLVDQVRIYKNGATKRLYIYDAENGEWDFVGLT